MLCGRGIFPCISFMNAIFTLSRLQKKLYDDDATIKLDVYPIGILFCLFHIVCVLYCVANLCGAKQYICQIVCVCPIPVLDVWYFLLLFLCAHE